MRGFSLVEMLVTLAIFSIIMAVVYSAYVTQVRTTTREYRASEAEMEMTIAKNVIERDLVMAGYGLSEDYSDATTPSFSNPRSAQATDTSVNGVTMTAATSWDELKLQGTALGIRSRQAMEWTYMETAAPLLKTWSDARENINDGDRLILMEPSTKKLITQGNEWLFEYDAATPQVVTVPGNVSYAAVGTLLYGLYGSDSDSNDASAKPYYTIRYYKNSGTTGVPSNCAPGSQVLMRGESVTDASPSSGAADHLIDCVLDFQVAFGLNTSSSDGSGPIDFWDNGGVQAAAYADLKDLNKRLKQIRVYILIQASNLLHDYTYPLTTVRVGDSLLGTGRTVNLTSDQRKYRWRLISMSVTPRNVR